MGKQTGNKPKHTGRQPGSLPTFFSPSSLAALQGTQDQPITDAAPGEERNGAPSAPLTKADLTDIKEDLKRHLTSLIENKLDPIAEQLSALNSTLVDVATTANMAHETSEKNGGMIHALQTSKKQLKERILWLEHRARSMNLKLRGFPESTDFNKNLLHNIISWLTPLLRLADDESPTIMAAYRVGSPTSIRPNMPRDIIIQFLYSSEREAVLRLARGSSSLEFIGSKIMILLDLPQEVLQKRRGLKIITDQLKAKGVRFRWNPASDVVVNKGGAQYKAEDIAFGHTLLSALNISLPPNS